MSKCAKADAKIRELAAAGHSFVSIGRLIGNVGHRHVSKYMRKNGILCLYKHEGPNNPAWKGGRMVDKHGYILVLRPEHPQANRHGYCREHRLVMEAVLGRPLLRSEVVHHKDSNRANNTPENLSLYASNGQHLADELRGRVPKWTPDGKERIRQSFDRGLGRVNKANREARAAGGPPSRSRSARQSV